MAPRVTWCDAAICLHLGEQRKSLSHARNDVNDPESTLIRQLIHAVLVRDVTVSSVGRRTSRARSTRKKAATTPIAAPNIT